MQTTYALLLTALVSIVFFSLGWAVAWRMLARHGEDSGYCPPAKNPAAGQPDRLQAWVSQQTKPFALADAAHGIGLPLEKLTPAVVTRLGIELKKLGCKRCFDADHKGLYSPLVRDEQEAPTIKVPRQNIFIGTMNEADYASVPGPAFFSSQRMPHGQNAALHDGAGQGWNFRLIAQNVFNKTAPAFNYIRRMLSQRVH